MKLYNIVKVYTSTTGTGTVTLGSALPSFITFATAAVINGSTVSYAIEDGNNREVGTGVYTSGAETLTRNVVTSTNSNSLITLSGSAVVFITGLAADLSSDTAATANTLVIRNGSGNFALGTPTSGTLTNCTGLPVSTGVSGLGNNVSAFLSAPSSFYSTTPYNWSQTPGGSLIVGTNTITLSPVPLGVSGTGLNVGQRIRISGGSGGPDETVIITGGSASTLTFNAANPHTGAWTVSSASFGLQEAINVAGAANGGTIRLPTGTSILRGTVIIDYNNITIEGTGGGCCSLGSTIERTGDFGDSIQVGTSAQGRNMINFADFAMTHVINYVRGNPGTIVNKPTSGAHIRLWGTNTANLNRLRLENMVNNLVITGSPLVTVADSSFIGLWNPASATVQVTESSVLVNQTPFSAPAGAGIASYISLLNNVFFGYQSDSPGYPNVGPKQMVEIRNVEDLIIDGGSMGGASESNVRLNPAELPAYPLANPALVMNIRIVNVKFDSANGADIEIKSGGVIRSNNVLIANNIFNGETVGSNAILVSDFGSGTPAVTGLVVTGNNVMAYKKTPFMLLDGKGFTVTGNSIRYYNTSNLYAAEADASAIYFGGRSDQALVTGNQLGGAAAYEPYGSGGNYCLFGISIALPLTTQNGVRLLGNYPAYWTALGPPYGGPVFNTIIPTIPGRAFKFSEPTVIGGSVSLASINDQSGALISSEFRSTSYEFVNGNVRVGTTTPTPGGTFEVQGGRSFFSAVNEPFSVAAKFINTGGSVFFGASNGTATPDAQISSSSGAALMTLLNNGNVGIGTQVPRTKLSVLQSGTANTTADSLGPAVFTGPTATAGFTAMLVVESNDAMAVDKGGSIGFYGRNDATTNSSYFASIHGLKENGTSGNQAGYLAFKVRTTGNTNIEAMRIAATGNVGIGTTTPAYKLEISTDSAGKPGVGGLWTVVSDERIKTDITPADLDRCYEIVKSVPLKHFGFAPGVYTDDQVNDKHSLGWIAQDVQKVFSKAVSVKPFALKTEIPDGTEEYTEQDFKLETVEKTEKIIEVIDGKPVQVSKVVTSENKVLLFDSVDVVDESGAVVMDGDNPLTYQMPRMVTKTRNKVRHDVIEDCLDLNGGQMIAALYGAVQALMLQVERLKEKK